MRRKIPFFLPVVLTFSGCALLEGVVKRILPPSSAESTRVQPVAALNGRAARLQDSLSERLHWLERRSLPGPWKPGMLGFENRPDSTAVLVLRLRDPRGWNSSGRTREVLQVQARERARKELESAVRKETADAGWKGITILRLQFRSRDMLSQGRSSSRDDSADLVLEPRVQ